MAVIGWKWSVRNLEHVVMQVHLRRSLEALVSGATLVLGLAMPACDALALGTQISIGGKSPALHSLTLPVAADRSLKPAYLNVFPAESEPFGVAFGEWEAQALQSFFSMPVAAAVDDGSASSCMIGQRGPVWIPIAGVPLVKCSIPADRAIMIGYYQANFNTPDLCGQVGSLPARVLRDQLAANFDPATISITIDGATVPNVANRYRIKSPVFSMTLPADNMVNQYCGGPGSIPAGVYSPAIADGIFVIVRPLPVGRHQMRVHVDIPAQSWNFDTDYEFEVVPVSRR
jgi:hypothetical protein